MRTSGRAGLALVAVLGLSWGARAQLFSPEPSPPKTLVTPPESAPAPAATAPKVVAPALPSTAISAVTAPQKKDATEARAADLAEFSRAFAAFQSEVKEYREDAQDVIERQFQEQKGRISGEYDRGIRELESDERTDRLDAIGLFERFLERYPDSLRYTADAMTRLAELYYEKSVDDADQVLAAYEEAAKLGTAGTPPTGAENFDKSIALYQQIITRFPRYRLIDTIYYLLGWCLNEQGEGKEARDTFRTLIAKYPDSRHVPEAWMRIGEYYFNDTSPGDPRVRMAKAAGAYQHVLAFPKSPLYDKALYKLGWSYYRLNDFDHGVDAFVKLLDYYSERKKNAEAGGGELWKEAMQYTAISFADDTWGGTVKNPDGTVRFLGVQKLVAYFQRIGDRPYEGELFKRLGDVLFDSTKYLAAVDAYRIVLERDPNAPGAPKVDERIVECYARAGDKDQAFAERQALVDRYGPKSAWAKANQADHDVIQAATELVRNSLLATAQYHHEQAIEYEKEAADPKTPPEKKVQLAALAFQEYQKAAKGYGDFLTAFSHTKNLYEIEFYHADTLFHSLQFLAAAKEYARVRDSNEDDKYLADAAYYVVLSYQKEIEQEEQNQVLQPREPCTAESCKDVKGFKPVAIPPIRLALIQAADTYLQRIPTANDAPLLSYAAALTYFTYFHFDVSRQRDEDVIKRYPNSVQAGNAYDDILTSYLLVKNWPKVEETASRMLKESKLVQADPAKFEKVRLLKYGARFERANQAMQKQEWDEAAKLYLSIVDDTERELKSGEAKQPWVDADKALYNAAACYNAERKFDSAMNTYERLYTNYPKSDLAEKSLFSVAENAEKAFDFDKAIKDYELLVRSYTKPAFHQDRVSAQFNAAKDLEAMQRYQEAADAYRDYAKWFPDQPDAPDMEYRGVLMYQRMHDEQGMIDRLQAFIRRYDRKPKQAEKIVEAYQRIGDAYEDLEKPRQALQAYASSVRAFDQKRMTPQNFLAASAASKAKFELVEEEYQAFKRMRFDPRGRGKRLTREMKTQLTALAQKLDEVKKDYETVIVRYQWPEWMMAALFRIGNLYEEFANKLTSAPCPPEVKALGGDEACGMYLAQVGNLVAPILDKATNAYVTAQTKAKQVRISDQWTKLTSEKVCEVSPSDCIALKDPRAKLIFDDLSALPLAADASGVKPVEYKADLATQAPTIQNVVPREAQVGQTLTVSGQNFGTDPAAIALKLGELELHVLTATATTLTVQVPAGAKSGPVQVTTQQGTYTTPFRVVVGAAPGPAGIGSPAAILAPAPAGGTPAPGTTTAIAPAPAPPPKAVPPSRTPISAPLPGGGP